MLHYPVYNFFSQELESDGNLKCSEEYTFLSMLFTTPKCEGMIVT